MSDDFADLSSDLSADPAADGVDSGSFNDDLMSTQYDDVDLSSEDMFSGDGPTVIAEPAEGPAAEPAVESPSDAAGAGYIDMTNGDSSYYAGEASLDADGDGVMDTAVQETVDVNGNDQVEYYIDEDGDHQTDQLVITDSDGNLVSNTEYDDATGEFVETEFAGELGPDGPSVADTNAPAAAPADASTTAAAPADATQTPPSGLRGGGPN